jgi:hypothetical protein
VYLKLYVETPGEALSFFFSNRFKSVTHLSLTTEDRVRVSFGNHADGERK